MNLQTRLSTHGHVLVPAPSMHQLLHSYGPLDDWETFAHSWENMPLDGYMADGGRYRRRRHATYAVSQAGQVQRQAHQPHFQSRDYNPLNGGVQRWFEPVEERIGSGATMTSILQCCAGIFSPLSEAVANWHVEAHQFRVEASNTQPGNPTPEGIHRDGVDYVLVMLVHRSNVEQGTTTIYAPDGSHLGQFTLTAACDATFLDDTRVFHGVTPVIPINPTLPGFRDVLVITFRQQVATAA